MAKSVHDTVDEIELEAKNQHTESCFIHAYIKVFNKWLDNLGRTNATFEHIKDAVSATIEAKEALELVLSIERFDLIGLIVHQSEKYELAQKV
jgi:hypothetical protein